MKQRTITLAPGDTLILKVRGGGIAIPEHHGFRFYAELGGKVNATTERVLTSLAVESEGLGWCLSVTDHASRNTAAP